MSMLQSVPQPTEAVAKLLKIQGIER